jgi:Helix-turn-helix domain
MSEIIDPDRQGRLEAGWIAEDLYRKGASISDCAEKLRCSYSFVRNLLVERGVPIRHGGWGKHQRSKGSQAA